MRACDVCHDKVPAQGSMDIDGDLNGDNIDILDVDLCEKHARYFKEQLEVVVKVLRFANIGVRFRPTDALSKVRPPEAEQ